jgi:hypothetical protein
MTIREPKDIWWEQCEAARGIRKRFGPDAALDYLISEKLLNHANAALQYREFARELAGFRRRGAAARLEYNYSGPIEISRSNPRFATCGAIMNRLAKPHCFWPDANARRHSPAPPSDNRSAAPLVPVFFGRDVVVGPLETGEDGGGAHISASRTSTLFEGTLSSKTAKPKANNPVLCLFKFGWSMSATVRTCSPTIRTTRQRQGPCPGQVAAQQA